MVLTIGLFLGSHPPTVKPKPLDLPSMTNAAYIKALGAPDQVVPGCPFFSGDSTGFKLAIYVNPSPGDPRITAVCVPSK